MLEERFFCCSKHWNSMPGFYRDKIDQANYDYRKDYISASEKLDIENAACRELGWSERTPAIPKMCCRHCGRHMLLAHREDGTGMVSLEEVRNITVAAMHQSELVVIIGFTAFPAADFAHAGSYALFKEHRCRRLAATQPDPPILYGGRYA